MGNERRKLGLRFNFEEIERVNKIRDFILSNNDSKKLDELRCPLCGGSGLECHQSGRLEIIWKGEFCSLCKGVGYISQTDIVLCDSCKGIGKILNSVCTKCNGRGYFKKIPKKSFWRKLKLW